MTFVTANSGRPQLEKLTQELVSAFPGSTIYQHTQPLRVAHDVLTHKVDAVVLEAEMEKISGLDLLERLRRQKPDLPVFITSKSNDLYEEAAAVGASGYFVLPDGEQELLEAVRSACSP